jgi:hypothetical protein
MITDKTTGISFAAFALISVIGFAQAPTTQLASVTLQNVKVQGSLDLENEVPIRWRKPDGSGYVTIFTLDKNGTLQLCHDPFFFDQPSLERTTKPTDPEGIKQMQMLERQHQDLRVIEVRNPHSSYPDLRLPITRSRPGGKQAFDFDSKLMARSATFIETNDPAELNLIRTGDEAKPVSDEDAAIHDGTITGLVRFIGRTSQPPYPGALSGYTKDAEIKARSYGSTEPKHSAALLFELYDHRFPEGPTMVIMGNGARVGYDGRKMAGVTGAMLEVDSHDDRPVIFRRHDASTTQPVMLALATGKNGTAADESNSLAVIKAMPVGSSDALSSRVQIQTSKGGKLSSDWVLPVPAAAVAGDAGDTPQRIASGELAALSFKQKRYDSDAMFDAAAPARLTCRTAGRYAISAAVEFDANAKGSRQVMIRLNGSDEVAAMRVGAAEDESTQITFTAPPIELKAGDYIELLVRQTSGSPLQVKTAPTFTATRVG